MCHNSQFQSYPLIGGSETKRVSGLVKANGVSQEIKRTEENHLGEQHFRAGTLENNITLDQLREKKKISKEDRKKYSDIRVRPGKLIP